LLLLVAIAVKMTSRGPVFFRQQRDGLNSQAFAMYKFRTMWADAGDNSGITQTTKGDRRITPVGRFLRRTSIDELPQLLNVLKGDMSIVGPRPHVNGMLAAGIRYDVLVREYYYRLQMRPGITGWAQANGFRGETVESSSAIGRIEHDFAYIQNFSLALDLWIVLKTVRNEFLTGSGH
jgi:lipopolysaccharide/colanic/teichoic acid biosynthesis glycosyltransferase